MTPFRAFRVSGVAVGFDDKKSRDTTNGKPPDPEMEGQGAPKPIDPKTGQHGAYYVLPEEERAVGYVRPVRKSYKHNECDTVTTMGDALAETYAKDPKYYESTFCAYCQAHFPVDEFVWDGTDEVVGS